MCHLHNGMGCGMVRHGAGWCRYMRAVKQILSATCISLARVLPPHLSGKVLVLLAEAGACSKERKTRWFPTRFPTGPLESRRRAESEAALLVDAADGAWAVFRRPFSGFARGPRTTLVPIARLDTSATCQTRERRAPNLPPNTFRTWTPQSPDSSACSAART